MSVHGKAHIPTSLEPPYLYYYKKGVAMPVDIGMLCEFNCQKRSGRTAPTLLLLRRIRTHGGPSTIVVILQQLNATSALSSVDIIGPRDNISIVCHETINVT
jgi:hypothetical protein